jgi:hypothetical protein
MLKVGQTPQLAVGPFSIFAILGVLALLVGANMISPGCTGPAVERCDYVATAKRAVAGSPYHHPFLTDRGFDIFDQGSSVLVQETDVFGPYGLNHSSSVLIDKKSCRPCALGYFVSEPTSIFDMPRGPLIEQIPPEDPAAARRLLARIRAEQATWGD